MLIHNFTLNNFVCPIPVCQPEADLGSILDIFRHLNCKLLAIPRDNGNWGIIKSEDLLSLIAKVWSQKKTAVVSYPKVGYQENTPNLSTEDFNSIIKPVITCQADTKLPKFLNYLQQDFLSADNECLIVNATGELQGKLDLNKILKYLAKSNQSQANIGEPKSVMGSVLSLIDSISLPLKVETIEGKNISHNKCWQKLIASSQNVSRPKTDTHIASWWMEQQLSLERIGNKQPDLEDKHHCGASDCHIVSSIDIMTSQSSAKIVDYGALDIEDGRSNQTDSQFNIQIEQARDWNYIKIPFTLTAKVLNGETPSYWLVLATKISIENLQYALSTDLSATRITTNRLLETIAHELKSPVTGIIGLSSLLEGSKLGKLNQRQTRYIQLIANSGQKMMSIVKDLIKLTSSTAERPRSKPESIDLKFLCQQTYRQVLTELQLLDKAENNSSAAIRLDLNIESGAGTAIANLSRLSSILYHLVTETIQFSEAVDTLSIKIKYLPETIAITIANSLDSDLLSLASESTSTHTGLNLIIAKYLAEIVKGEVKSVYWNDRCQFTLTLAQDDSLSDKLSTNLEIPAKNAQKNLTILCLYPEPEAIDPQRLNNDSDFELQNWSSNSEQHGKRYHVIEADGLEQADILARIWQLDVIVLDGYQIINPSKYLRSLQELERLSALPLITLDTKTTEVANQTGLDVYPCLLPAKHRSVENLMQVIQIATGSQRTIDNY